MPKLYFAPPSPYARKIRVLIAEKGIGAKVELIACAPFDRPADLVALNPLSKVPTLVGGDFNVIPEDIDCHKPASWIHDALFQPEPRARYRVLLALGYTDAFRSLHPGQAGQFTFWDYFRHAFEHNRGIRIDHFLLSPELAGQMETCEIDKTPRGREKPSDHTPILLQLR